jgi:aldose sugar dehydrogenase
VAYYDFVRTRLLLLGVCLAIAACGDDKPGSDPNVPDGFEPVTGSERLSWNPGASSEAALATFRYRIYVDRSAGIDLQNVSCASDAGGFVCNAPLPVMSEGRHALSLSSYIDSAGRRLESARSEPLMVFKVETGSIVRTSARLNFPFGLTTTDGVKLSAQVVADDLEEPVDFAFAPDGGVFIAERGGRIRIWRAGHMIPEPAVTLADVATKGGGGLLGMAIDPQFDRNRFLYVVYTAESGFRLARFRAVGATLGDRAILLEGVPSSPVSPSASLRFGPDAQLYLSLDDGGDSRRGGDLGSFNGKTLRLKADAATSLDQPGSSPIFAANLSAPRGAAWDASGATLWLLDDSNEGPTFLQVVTGSSEVERRTGRSRAIARHPLPDGAVGSALAFYHSDRAPELRGNLLVAQKGMAGDAAILRLVFDPGDSRRVMSTERLLRGSIDGANALGVSPDGIIYLGTHRSLITITPVRPQ